MANVKSAGVREIILDRCLKKRRGYSVNELLEKINKELEFNGLRPVTSGNTIRNDLTNISNRWQQPIEEFKRGHAVCYRYADPSFSIYHGQLSRSEIKLIHSVLLNTKFMDLYQGCSLFDELITKMEGQLYPHAYQQPILLYENIPDERTQRHQNMLYDCIRRQQPVRITISSDQSGQAAMTVHPYFLRQQDSQWHLLGQEDQSLKAVCIRINDIISIVESEGIPFVPNTTFSAEAYYDALRKSRGK